MPCHVMPQTYLLYNQLLSYEHVSCLDDDQAFEAAGIQRLA